MSQQLKIIGRVFIEENKIYGEIQTVKPEVEIWQTYFYLSFVLCVWH